MAIQDKTKLVEVYFGEYWQAKMIQNLLEENQIDTFMENEFMGSIAPWRIAAGGFKPFNVIVTDINYELSMKLIEEFNASQAVDDKTEE